MAPRTRWLILSFAVAGLAFASSSTYFHYRLITDPSYISPCDINAQFNCSELYLSRFGSIQGVPVALGGIIFFVIVGLIAALSDSHANPSESPATAYVFAMSTIGLASILYLGWASAFVLKRWCVLCMGTYAAVIGLFIVSGASSAFPMSRLPKRLAGDVRDLMNRPLHLLATLGVIVMSVSLVGCFPKEGASTAAPAGGTNMSAPAGASEQENFERIWAQQPRVDLGVPAGGAKVVIVKFIDYQCPACKAAHSAYKPILAKIELANPGAIKAVTKDYPLNSRCNFNIGGQNHAAACEAAAAVRLASEKGRTDEMVDFLFARQESLTPQSVEAQVKTTLGVTDFAREYARLLPDIKRDAADGGALQVRFTPTYYVNGVKAQTDNGNFLVPQYFEWAVNYELKKAGGK
jgi:uncharacterized membrane protein